MIKSALFVFTLFLLSVGFLMGFPKALNLVQSKVTAEAVPNNQVVKGSDAEALVAGVAKVNVPPASLGLTPPLFSATAVLVQDFDSGFVLFEKDSNKRVPIASTTKIMTALVAAEHFKPNEVLTAKDLSAAGGSTMGLKTGERLTFRSLLYGMLLNSGNDAAYTLAENYPGGINSFIEEMNFKAKSLGLENTHFDNPAGFDSPNHYSSAADLGRIAMLAADNPQLARVVGTKETSVASIDKSTVHPLKNLNKLLNTPGVLGMKTGTTPAAKENLVGLVEKNEHKILTVVLGSDDRFGETQSLIDWVYSNFTW